MTRTEARRFDHSSVRFANAAARIALAEEAAMLASELERIAAKYGRKPSTVAKIAVARTRA